MESIVGVFTNLLDRHGIIIFVALSGYAMALFGTMFHLRTVKRAEDQDKYLKDSIEKLKQDINNGQDDYKKLSGDYHKELINVLDETTQTMNDIGNKFEILKQILISRA